MRSKKKVCDNRDCEEIIEVNADYEYEYCCDGIMCGCYAFPINPTFCESCEKEIYGTKIREGEE